MTQDTPGPSPEDIAALIEDAARWRRAVRACLSESSPDAEVECCSHLALLDAEKQIEGLIPALNLSSVIRCVRLLEDAFGCALPIQSNLAPDQLDSSILQLSGFDLYEDSARKSR